MLTRRTLISGSCAAAISTRVHLAHSQPLVPVRLLVLRRPGLSVTNQCVAPCIRGQIFDLSNVSGIDLSTVVLAALAGLRPVCDTIERPYRNNQPNVSSIPRGVYPARIRDDASKPWMDNLNKRWRIELENVGGHRSAIQFHYGQDVGWSEGCFIVGELTGRNDNLGTTYCQLRNSEQAVSAIRAAVTATGRNSADVRVGVADDGGLFPNFTHTGSCS